LLGGVFGAIVQFAEGFGESARPGGGLIGSRAVGAGRGCGAFAG
jgi:hypothetical protein